MGRGSVPHTRRTASCTVLVLDAPGRQGYADAGATVDDEELAQLAGAIEGAWPGGDLLVSRSRYSTDAKRLHELPLDQYQRVVVVRPSALLLPAPVLRAAVEEGSTPATDVAVLSGVPPDVFYIVSARIIALVDSLAGVPGCVTLPQAVERLAGAGASLDETPLKVVRLASLADTSSRSVAAALVPSAWTTQRLGALLSLPSESRLAAALRLQQHSFQDARAALRSLHSCRGRRGTPLHRVPFGERPLPSTGLPFGERPLPSGRVGRDILVVVPSMFQSGAHAAWIEVSRYLSPAQVAFVVGRSTALQSVLEAQGFLVCAVGDGLAPGSAQDAAAFLAALDDVQPAVVHFDGAEGNAWAQAAFLRGARVVQHVRLNDVDRFRPAFVYADAIVGVSPPVCGQVEARVGSGLRVEHIPDGVCLESRPPRMPGTEGRPALTAGEAGEGLLCLCVGRVEPAKGQLRVLDIFRSLRSQLACRLILVGPCGNDAAYCDEVRDRMETPELAADVAWEPFTYPMDDLYRRAHVVLVGSRNEALGMVGLETLAAGGLLVAQRSTGYECIIDPARSEGLLYDSHEPASVVAASIVAALGEFPTYSANARRKAAASFDARDSAAHLSRLWREVAEPE